MLITLIVLFVTLVMFIWGRWRSDITALAAISVLMVSGVLTPVEALQGFASPAVIMMAGLFVVGGAILHTGLARAVGDRLMGLARGNENRALVLVMLSTSVIGAFVSNTGTVALMMPIVVSLASAAGFSSSRLLMPLAFAGSLGGMFTLIGTPPNLIINEELVRAGYEELGFFSFTPVGLIVVTIGVLMLLPLSRLLVKKKHGSRRGSKGKSLSDLVHEYGLLDNLHKYRVPQGSPLVGLKVGQTDLKTRYGATLVEIRSERKSRLGLGRDVSQNAPSGESVIAAGDLLYLSGPDEALAQMAKHYHLVETEGARLDFYDIGLAEIVVLPGSRLDGLRLSQSGLRQEHGVSVLGMRRGERYMGGDLGSERLHGGDVLLVQAQWNDLLSLSEQSQDWVVLGRPEQSARRVTLDYKAPTAAAIMLLMIALMVVPHGLPVQPVTAVIIAAVLMVVTGCFRTVDAAYKTINWESIVLIAAMMSMSTALEKTGVSALVSGGLAGTVGHMGPTALLAGIYVATSVLTMFISNTATAVLMAPVAMSAATAVGCSPYPPLMAVTLASSMCFASPFSTPPNALVMKAGDYTFMDYVKVGLPLQLVIAVVMIFVLPLLYP